MSSFGSVPITRASDQFYDARRLAYVIPVQPEDRVLVLGMSPTLTRSLHLLGAEPVTVVPTGGAGTVGPPGLHGSVVAAARPDRLPVDPAAFDHVIDPSPNLGHPGVGTSLPELMRVLRPGGWLCAGAAYRGRAPWDRKAFTVAGSKRRLARAGFADVEVYGVRRTLIRPQFLVPLTDQHALQWFLSSVYLPTTPRNARSLAVATLVSRTGVPRLLFPHLLLVARSGGIRC